MARGKQTYRTRSSFFFCAIPIPDLRYGRVLIVEAIASCRATGKLFDSHNGVEARKKVVVQELSTWDSSNQAVFLSAAPVAEDFRNRPGEIRPFSLVM